MCINIFAIKYVGVFMKNTDINFIYSALGAFMLVLLQTAPFQNAIGFSNLMGIPYLGDIVFAISRLLSFIGVIVFVVSSIKLILNNFKKEQS